MRTQDYYEVLGVSADASNEEIKQAFRALAKAHHPDANDADDDDAYKAVSEAYAVLGDPARRQQYDQSRTFGGFGSIVGDLFGDFFGQRSRPTRVQAGRTIAFRVGITLEESFHGCSRAFEVTRQKVCSQCHGEGTKTGTYPERCDRCSGSGSVRAQRKTILGTMVTEHSCDNCGGTGSVITDPCQTCNGASRVAEVETVSIDVPAGAHHSEELVVRGGGDAGVAGGPSGDLVYVIDVAMDSRFRRVDDDLVCVIEVPTTIAALGGWLSVDTFDGTERIDIAKGAKTSQLVRVDGKGFVRRRRRGSGDLVVVLDVVVPQSLDRAQRKLIAQLAEMRGEADGQQASPKNPTN